MRCAGKPRRRPPCRRSRKSIRGDTPGTNWSLSVLRFAGASRDAPGHVPAGCPASRRVARHRGAALLGPYYWRRRSRTGRLLGNVTWSPTPTRWPWRSICSPSISAASTSAAGPTTTVNFPLLSQPDTDGLPGGRGTVAGRGAAQSRLLKLSVGHDIVLDLHCDDEALSISMSPGALAAGQGSRGLPGARLRSCSGTARRRRRVRGGIVRALCRR